MSSPGVELGTLICTVNALSIKLTGQASGRPFAFRQIFNRPSFLSYRLTVAGSLNNGLAHKSRDWE